VASFRSLGAATIAALLPPKARPVDAGAGLIVRASRWVRFDQPMRAQVRADIKSNPLFVHCFFREGRDHPMTDKRLGLSEREYACRAGISRGAQKARTSGRLVLHTDGSIDASASDVRRAQATDPSMQRGRRQPSLRPVPETAVGAVRWPPPGRLAQERSALFRRRSARRTRRSSVSCRTSTRPSGDSSRSR
jgi:hypothetical protein